MKHYAKIENGIVAERIDTDKNINTLYHPDFVQILVECDATVENGFIYDGVSFNPPVTDLINPFDEWRKTATITNAQARKNLAALELFDDVDAKIQTLPKSHPIYIDWEYAEKFHRNNIVLVGFLVEEFGFNDEQIDKLFSVA